MKKNALVVPSCNGLLDCFNSRYTYGPEKSHYCLQGDINTPMVVWLFSFLYIHFFNLNERSILTTWTFKTADFKKYIGYQKGGKSRDLYEQLDQLSGYTYLYNNMEQGQAIKVSFSQDHATTMVESRYFSELYNYMRSVMGTHKTGAGRKTGRPAYSSMVYSDIFKERSVSGCEVAIELCRLTERRGPLKEGEYAHVSIPSLAERCPTLFSRMTKQKRQKDVNKVFRTALKKGCDFLEMYTSIYDCFEGFRIELPPSMEIKTENVLKIFYEKRKENC